MHVATHKLRSYSRLSVQMFPSPATAKTYVGYAQLMCAHEVGIAVVNDNAAGIARLSGLTLYRFGQQKPGSLEPSHLRVRLAFALPVEEEKDIKERAMILSL